MNRKVERRERGITLIALIVTIIILMILAGISINILLSENGLIEKAKNTKEQQLIETIREKLNMVKGSDYIEKLGSSTIDTYFETLEVENIEPYTITNKQKMTDIIGNVEVDNKYSYLIIIEKDQNIKIEYEGKIGEFERKPDNIEIDIQKKTEHLNLPITLNAIVKANGVNVSTGKYIVNNSETTLGTEEDLYTYQIENSNVNIIIEKKENYYIHTLTTDKYGRRQETIKGPITILEKYHQHEGNSKINGGCYTTPIYHSHTSSCYTRNRCGSWNLIGFTGKTDSGLTIVSYECSGCGTRSSDVKDTSGNGWGRYDDDAYHWTQVLTCGLGNSIVGYNLSCNKTEKTIEGYIINY